ncbi:MAG: putative membrane protein, partial [Flavobacteriales bacterium]
PFKTLVRQIQSLHCKLGIYILLALDFLSASDIIHTIMEITTE